MAASATTTTNGVLGEDSSRCPSPLWLLETGQQTQTQSVRQTDSGSTQAAQAQRASAFGNSEKEKYHHSTTI